MSTTDLESLNRRRVMIAGAAAAISLPTLATAAPGMSGRSAEDMGLAAGADLAMPQPGDRNVIDQIVRIYGGWNYDQDAAEKMLAAKRAGADLQLPSQVLAYQRRSHGIQCAMQAQKHGADEAMIVAALLHDIGHVFSPEAPVGTTDYDDKHEIYASLWLRNAFITAVTEPVLRHVPGKRYLVTTRKAYWDKLSEGSKRSLEQQGGRMSPQELDEFEFMAYANEGVTLRLWDDDAKVKGLKLAPIETYVPMMEATLRKQAA
ncbi:MAG: HD domain-containing protein [Panacagrimonas sp.]